MSADRMERVKQKARENWADSMRPLTQYPLTAYLMGAEFGIESYRTLSEAEWAEMRETVARAIYSQQPERHNEKNRIAFNVETLEPIKFWEMHITDAEAAMRAVGLRREEE